MISLILFFIYFFGFFGILFVLGQVWARKEIHIYDYVEVSGTQIHYRVSGHGTKPIIFVHGMFSNQESWDKVRSLFEREYRVYSLDLPGMGESLLTDDTTTPEHAASIAEDLLFSFGQALHLEHPHVIGSSMGGVIAGLNFNKYQDYFDKCVLVSAPMSPNIMRAPIYKLHPLSPVLNLFVNPILVACTHYLTSKPNFTLEQTLAILCKFRHINHFKYSLSYTQVIYKTAALEKTWARPKSTFYVWGTSDHLIRPQNFKNFLAQHRDIQFVKLEHASHHPMESHPKAFFNCVNQFLNS